MFPGPEPAAAALRALSAGNSSVAPFPDVASWIEACRRGGSRIGDGTEPPFPLWRVVGGPLLHSYPLYKACAAFLQKAIQRSGPQRSGIAGKRLQRSEERRVGKEC